MSHKLNSKIVIKGKIIAETGLMIGGSSSALEIGGTDKQVIRNPVDKKPYVPGSSLKGKMRSLLEQAGGDVSHDGLASQNPDGRSKSAILFGFIKAHPNDSMAVQGQERMRKKQQPSRLIVRDGQLLNADKFKDTELLYTEVKAENTINRITAEANPRFFERVPKSAEFDLNMTLNIFESESEETLLKLVFECMRLVQDDYLGGGGTRGNGQVKFEIKDISKKSADYYKSGDKNGIIKLTIPEDLA
jgi:CRISPR-associated protein Csm3